MQIQLANFLEINFKIEKEVNKLKQNFNDIKQNWNFYMCHINNKPASIHFNLALCNIAPVEDYKYRISIFIKMNNPTEDGLSSDEEYPILCDIEDKVIEKLKTLEDIFAGTVKSQGKLELYVFTKNPKKTKKLCKEALANFPNYKWIYSINKDVEWDIYFNLLYPDTYSYHAIINRSVIDNLTNQGDNLEKEREIDHWLYFSSEKNINIAIKKVEELGYKILSNKKLDDKKNYPYQLNISRMDNAIYSHINQVVWELIEITEPLNGYYDGWGCPITK